MSFDFSVLSMPRTMSRWLSVALSYNGNTCYHDVSFDEVLPYEPGSKKIGTCDTGNVIEAEKRIVVLRNPDECIESLFRSYSMKSDLLSRSIRDRFDYLTELGERTYWAEQIRNPETVKEIQEYLLGESMGLDEIKTLLGARITVSQDYIEARLTELLWCGSQQQQQ